MLEILRRHRLDAIVLVRNIFDLVPSIYDHYRMKNTFMSMAFVPERVKDLPLEDAGQFIADMVIPWYINFYVSWTANGSYPIFTYEELNSDPESVVSRVAERLLVNVSTDAVAAAVARAQNADTRKNKAVVGRGADLPSSVKDTIRRYAQYYPDTDFSLIGL